MKHILEQIEKMKAEQEAEAGPNFADLCTPELWLELLRHVLKRKDADFETQMTEAASLAIWAIESHEKSQKADVFLEQDAEAWSAEEIVPETKSRAAFQFGPIDQPLRRSRLRK